MKVYIKSLLVVFIFSYLCVGNAYAMDRSDSESTTDSEHEEATPAAAAAGADGAAARRPVAEAVRSSRTTKPRAANKVAASRFDDAKWEADQHDDDSSNLAFGAITFNSTIYSAGVIPVASLTLKMIDYFANHAHLKVRETILKSCYSGCTSEDAKEGIRLLLSRRGEGLDRVIPFEEICEHGVQPFFAAGKAYGSSVPSETKAESKKQDVLNCIVSCEISKIENFLSRLLVIMNPTEYEHAPSNLALILATLPASMDGMESKLEELLKNARLYKKCIDYANKKNGEAKYRDSGINFVELFQGNRRVLETVYMALKISSEMAARRIEHDALTAALRSNDLSAIDPDGEIVRRRDELQAELDSIKTL